jgi:hypothetical protein
MYDKSFLLDNLLQMTKIKSIRYKKVEGTAVSHASLIKHYNMKKYGGRGCRNKTSTIFYLSNGLN